MDGENNREPAARGESASPPPQPAPTVAKSFVLNYSPMWDTRNEALLLFRPIVTDALLLFGSHHDVDLAVLNRIHHDLAALAQQGRRIPVIAPVDAETIVNSKNRTGYLSVLRDIPLSIRRLIVIEAPADQMAIAGFSGLAADLSALGIALALSGTLDFQAMSEARRLAAKFVLCDVTNIAELEKPALEQLERFASAAQICGLECGIVGARTKPIVVAAVTAGFRFVAGQAVSAAVPSLEKVVRYSPLDIFAPNR